MCAKVADIHDSDETIETPVPKRGRKPKYLNPSNSERSSGNKRCNQSATRRSARHQKKNLVDQTPPKVKLFPIFTSCRTNDKNHKEIIKEGKSNGIDDKQPYLDSLKIKSVGNSEEKLPIKILPKRSKVKRSNRKKTAEEILGDLNDNKLINLDCNKTDSQANLFQSENAVLPSPINNKLINLDCNKTDSQANLFQSESTVLPSPIDTESEVCKIVNDISTKTAKAVGCDNIFSITHNSLINSDSSFISENLKFNGNDKIGGFKKQKKKRHNFTECDKSDKISDNADDTIEISDRRRSLRNRGNRNDLINYSEIEIDYKKGQRLKTSLNSSVNCEDECVVLNSRGTEHSKNIPTDNCRNNDVKGKEGENVKEKVKFFPIFTSNKIPNESFKGNSLNKRKASVEEIFIENDNKNSNSRNNNLNSAKRKKQNNECALQQSTSVEHNSLSFDSLKNLDKENNSSLMDSQSKISENNDNIISSLEDKERESSCKSFDRKGNQNKYCKSNSENIAAVPDSAVNECTSSKLGSAVLKLTSDRKVHNLYSESMPFPILSHLNTGVESLPDTANKYLIYEEVSVSDIILPIWNETIGLTDIHCIKDVIMKNNSDSRQKIKSNYTNQSSDSTENENDKMLWTDSLQNTVTVEKNNENTVKEIKSWLLQWKSKFCRVTEEKKYNSDSETFSSDSDSDDDNLSNSIIISGAPGSGKTSLVFSLANELGFTVIEVNASSSRTGRNISNQLKEALESYHVENIRIEKAIEDSSVNVNKEKSNEFDIKTPRINQNKNIKSFFERKNQESTSVIEKKKGIAAFFQTSNCEEKCTNSNRKTRNRRLDKSESEKNKNKNSLLTNEKDNNDLKCDKNFCKISSLTIILFEDVDIVFEEDEGFWSTIKGFLKISKKPVIFTVSRNLSIIKTILNSDIDVFAMKSTSKESVVKKIETCCKTYLMEDTKTDLELLSSQNMNDLRRNILNAQFWTKNPNKLGENKYFDISNCNLSKSVHMNTFIIGELNFSPDLFRKLLLHDVPYYFLNALSQYQMLGYDVLYNNIFYILNILDFMKCEKVWQSLSCENCSSSNTKSFSDAQMWEEACEIFKLKKLALQNGSPSHELTLIGNAMEDFSFADTLKNASLNKFQWISGSERIKMWNSGLPICSDHSKYSYDSILQIISLIHIYILRKILSTDYLNSNSCESKRLILEHPFLKFDQEFAYKTEEDLRCLSAVLPPSQQLNKVALTLDYLSIIKIICQDEERRQLNSGKRSGRFLHYFDSISFYLDKTYILST